jgi:hypothetical protein
LQRGSGICEGEQTYIIVALPSFTRRNADRRRVSTTRVQSRAPASISYGHKKGASIPIVGHRLAVDRPNSYGQSLRKDDPISSLGFLIHAFVLLKPVTNPRAPKGGRIYRAIVMMVNASVYGPLQRSPEANCRLTSFAACTSAWRSGINENPRITSSQEPCSPGKSRINASSVRRLTRQSKANEQPGNRAMI